MSDKMLSKGTEILVVSGSKTAAVVFGGINQGIGLPSFGFRRVLSDHNINRIFVRDISQRWYHNGLGYEACTDIERTALFCPTP